MCLKWTACVVLYSPRKASQVRNQIRLRITQLQKADEGTYELRARSGDAESRAQTHLFVIGQFASFTSVSNFCNRLLSRSNCNLNLQVHVFCLVRPQVSLVMPRGYPYYSTDFYHTLTCRYRGDPAPTIQWQWQPCNTVRCLPTGNWTQTKYTSRDIYQRDVSFDRIFCSYSNKFTCASMRH